MLTNEDAAHQAVSGESEINEAPGTNQNLSSILRGQRERDYLRALLDRPAGEVVDLCRLVSSPALLPAAQPIHAAIAAVADSSGPTERVGACRANRHLLASGGLANAHVRALWLEVVSPAQWTPPPTRDEVARLARDVRETAYRSCVESWTRLAVEHLSIADIDRLLRHHIDGTRDLYRHVAGIREDAARCDVAATEGMDADE